jgi:hypothetical protein
MSTYGFVLVFICLFDLLFTVAGIKANLIIEKGPLLAWYYQAFGLVGLAGAKIWLNLCSIFVLETAYQRNWIESKQYQTAIILYLVILLSGSLLTTFI